MPHSTLAATLGPLQTWLTQLATSSRHGRRRARFDPRELSLHLNRDLGFLDGRDPAGTIR
ncbi:hypothetical protein [Aminobacter aminovorans]|jgi:hypothetical protein|uniref:hypothetical protein n=1 Tax=Aminobacter TaxID=31988 RepID=UPI00285C4F1E|nr:hypothetical protein [Aminobacter aminovorans]MDR7219691.1 hypothetical protein [Aminobacter aminovorans]